MLLFNFVTYYLTLYCKLKQILLAFVIYLLTAKSVAKLVLELKL